MTLQTHVYAETGALVPSFTPNAAQGRRLRQQMHLFRRHLHLFGAIVIAAVGLALAVSFIVTPRYTAVASVMLDRRTERVSNVAEVLSPAPSDSSAVDTEVSVIKSRQLADRVVVALDLDHDGEFNPRLAATDRRAAPLAAAEQNRLHQKTIDAVLRRLSVKRDGLTYVMNIGFESVSAAKAARIANAFADFYIGQQLEAKLKATDQATHWLDSRIGTLRAQVLADEDEVQKYRIANNLLSAAGATLTEQDISAYNQSLAAARAGLAEDEARLNTARAQLAGGSSGDDVGEALNSPVIQKLREQRTEVSNHVADLQGRYGARHPEMLKAQRELQDTDNQIQAEIHRLISNLEAKVQVSKERVGAIQGSVHGAKGVLAANNEALVRLNELERKADASRTLYASYLSRYQETSTQQGAAQADARIVSRAMPPTRPSSPNMLRNLAFGLAAGLAGGTAGVALAQMLDAGLTTGEEVERRLQTTYLGAVPLLSSLVATRAAQPEDYVAERPLSGFAEAFRTLHAGLVGSRRGARVRVVAVTSALPAEGKTTTSICLARALAMHGSRVILVNCDLRRRHATPDNEVENGLVEVLRGEVELADAVRRDVVAGVHVLDLAGRSAAALDQGSAAAMDQLLEQLRALYDLVVLDCAPVLPLADTRLLAPKADAVLFLARWRKTEQPAIEAALRMLEAAGAPVSGVALTQVDMRRQVKFGYGDPSYYYGDYRPYYSD